MVRSMPDSGVHRQIDFDDAASFGSTVLQFQRAAMRLRNLSREHEADTTAGWLRCIERNKRIAGIHQPRPAILNSDDQFVWISGPGQNDRRFSLTAS